VSLPTADDLFRPTDPAADRANGAPTEVREPRAERRVRAVPETTEGPDESRSRRPSGRVRHDEKMTVYVTADELFDIEHARLQLRRAHGKAVDRGRLVRAAIAMALADLDTRGPDSELVRRLDEA
jgi:hypothetical protein